MLHTSFTIYNKSMYAVCQSEEQKKYQIKEKIILPLTLNTKQLSINTNRSCKKNNYEIQSKKFYIKSLAY